MTLHQIFTARFITCLLSCSLWSLPAFAQNSAAKFRTKSGVDVLVNARTLSRDLDRQIVELKDDVHIIYGQQSFKSDEAVLYLQTEEVEARGNVVIETPSSRIEATWLKLNYKTNTGELRNAVIRSGQITLEGLRIEQIAEDEYIAENAYFTACDTCPPAWSFRGSRVRAKLGGYAHVKNAWFEIAHLPVLPIPYMIFPLKSERQTGLLIPSIGYEDGTTFSDEFFWAISRSQDATLQAKQYQARGLLGGLNYRYMLTNQSSGELNMSALRDKKFLGNNSAYNRWYIGYDHFYELPDNFTQYSRINLVSDLFYPRDFEKQVFMARNNPIPLSGEPALENRVYLARSTDNTFAGIDSSYYVNLLRTQRTYDTSGATPTSIYSIDAIGDNSDAVHRFPELRYSITQSRVANSDLLFRMDLNYVNFARQDFGYDDVVINRNPSVVLPTSDPCYDSSDNSATVCEARGSSQDPTVGQFNPDQDVIRSGQRLQVSPELTYPFHVAKAFDITPRLGYQHTRYAFNVSPESSAQSPSYSGAKLDEDPTRDLVRSSISFRMRMSRIYGLDRPKKETRYRHEFEPEIIFSGVPYFRQSQSRFLGNTSKTPAFLETQPISDTDFLSQHPTTSSGQVGSQGIQFDYNDRIYNRTLATAVLTNKLVRKSWDKDTAKYRQIVNFKLMQSYDFEQANETPNKYPWGDIAALTDVRFENFGLNSTIRYFPYHNKTNSSTSISANDKRGNSLTLGVTQTFLITTDLDEAYDKRDETVFTGASIGMKYLRLSGQVNWLPKQWEKFDWKVKSWGSIVTVSPPGGCWGIRTIFTQEIGAESKVEVNFDWNNLGF